MIALAGAAHANGALLAARLPGLLPTVPRQVGPQAAGPRRAGTWSLPTAAPVGRGEAADAARRELSKGVYHADDPSPVQRVIDRVSHWLSNLLDQAAGAAPGGSAGLLVLVLLIAALIALVFWRVGPLRRGAAVPHGDIELSGPLDADEHRLRANRFAGQRQYAEAVRERMRAIVRELESRGVLEHRPGRTADEVAREAGRLVPAVATDLDRAARLFDEVWYGGRPATAGADAAMREADQRVRKASLAVRAASTVGPTRASYQVPR